MCSQLKLYKAVIFQMFQGPKKTWGLFLVILVMTVVGHAEPANNFATFNQINAATKLSIAFASQNNHQPESAFGHVFLVLHQQTPPEPNAQVIEFVGHLESFQDMLATLHSEVDGRYRVLEFSEKSLGYDLESRDLYLIELKTEPRQLEQLVGIVRQQTDQNFPYTFAKYNCAYYLAVILEKQDFLTRQVSSQIYVEPVDLIKVIDEKKVAHVSFIPSSHRVLSQYKSQLTPDQLLALERFERGNDIAMETDNDLLSQTLSAYIRYQLPREPEAWKRQHLASSQKKIWHDVPEMNATSLGEDTRGQYALSVYSGGAIGMRFQPELRNFFSMHAPNQAGAYLDLLSIDVIERGGHLDVSQFTVFRSESIHPESNRSRLLDISYRNWEVKTHRSDREAYLTWGIGPAFDVNGVSMAVIPNLTLAATQSDANATNIRLGYRALAEWHSAAIGLRIQTDRWTNSPFLFSHEDTVQVRFKVDRKTNIGWEIGRVPQLNQNVQRLMVTRAI